MRGDGAVGRRVDGHHDAAIPEAQRAIVMVLEAIYEQDFLPCSYGFRPGRSAHQALQALRTGWSIPPESIQLLQALNRSRPPHVAALAGDLDR
jgi:hypothetical protein